MRSQNEQTTQNKNTQLQKKRQNPTEKDGNCLCQLTSKTWASFAASIIVLRKLRLPDIDRPMTSFHLEIQINDELQWTVAELIRSSNEYV